MRNELPVDTGMLVAAQRGMTGANAHCLGELTHQYKVWCRRGHQWMADRCKEAIYMVLREPELTFRRAMGKAYDQQFERRKEEIRQQGWWSKDWEKYLGPSPQKQKQEER